jgi:acyl-CoA hydrolase
MDHLRLGNDVSVHPGEVVIVEAQVVRCFHKSAEVIVRVLLDLSLSSTILSGSQRQQSATLCLAHGFFIFVRLDKQKMPIVFPQTLKESQEYELSMERRKYRQSKKEMIENSPTDSNLQSVSYNMTPTDSVAADQSLLQYTYIVMPTHANHMGNTFGGQLLEWAEEIALLSARKHVNAALRSQIPLVPLHPSSSASPNEEIEFSELVLTTIYVHEMSFLAPSTIGDRITCQAQGCQTYGSIIEVEVIIRANNVEHDNPRHINTGYFLIMCRNKSNTDIVIPPLRPVTFEDKLRFEYSLKRMILVTIRSKSDLNQLEMPLQLREYQTQSHSSLESSSLVPLTDMFRIYETSIWNSSGRASPTAAPHSLSTVFNDLDYVLVQEYALQDIIGLLCALSSRDLSPQQDQQAQTDQDIRWELLYSNKATAASSSNGFIEMAVCRGGATGVRKVKVTAQLHQKVSVVADYLLNFTRRHEWDHILSGEVMKTVIEDQVDLVRMRSGSPSAEETEAETLENEGKQAKRKLIDYCLLRCHRQLDDGRYAIVSRSIIHPSVPPVPGYLRGEVLPSGYLLTPVPNATTTASTSDSESKDWTLLQYVLQLDSVSAKQFEGRQFMLPCSSPSVSLYFPSHSCLC